MNDDDYALTHCAHTIPGTCDFCPSDDDETLGPCGCTDYHMADCSRGGAWLTQPDPREYYDDAFGDGPIREEY